MESKSIDMHLEKIEAGLRIQKLEKDNQILFAYIRKYQEQYSFLDWEKLDLDQPKIFIKNGKCETCFQWMPGCFSVSNLDDTYNILCPSIRKHYEVCPKFRALIDDKIELTGENKDKHCATERKKHNKHELVPVEKKRSQEVLKLDGLLISKPIEKPIFNKDEYLKTAKEKGYDEMLTLLFYIQAGVYEVHKVFTHPQDYTFSQKLFLDRSGTASNSWWCLFLEREQFENRLNRIHKQFLNTVVGFTFALKEILQRVENIPCFCFESLVATAAPWANCLYCQQPAVSGQDQCTTKEVTKCIHRYRHVVNLLLLCLKRISTIHSQTTGTFWNWFNSLWSPSLNTEFRFMDLFADLLKNHPTANLCELDTKCNCNNSLCLSLLQRQWKTFCYDFQAGDFSIIQEALNSICSTSLQKQQYEREEKLCKKIKDTTQQLCNILNTQAKMKNILKT